MKIAFMGTPSFAVPALKKINEVFKVDTVFTQPPRKSKRGMKELSSPVHEISNQLNLDVRTPNRVNDDLEFFKSKKFKIVLDCGNGATYEIAPNIFWELGHEVISINDKPNGKNINYNCGAVNTNALSKKVVDERADIGFAFDGDGDRLIIVDEKGNEIDGDKIIALFAKH